MYYRSWLRNLVSTSAACNSSVSWTAMETLLNCGAWTRIKPTEPSWERQRHNQRERQRERDKGRVRGRDRDITRGREGRLITNSGRVVWV